MPQNIDPPKLTKRPWGLLTDSADELGLDGKRWFDGVVTTPINGRLSRLTPEFCIGDPDDPYDAAITGTTDRFSSFSIVATETCSTLAVDMEWLQGRLVTRYDALVSSQIGAELEAGGYAPQVPNASGGAPLVDNPTLSNSAVPAASVPGTPDEALAAIEGALAYYLSGAVGMVHMKAEVLSLLDSGAVQLGADGIYRTKTGHVVVADAGYMGTPPEGISPETGVQWIYGSGPVAYQIVAIDGIDKPSENFDKARNNYTGRVMGQAIYAFDTNLVVAVPVDMPPIFGSEGS